MINLRSYRLKANLSQEAICEILKVSQGYYSQIETGGKKMPFKFYPILAKIFELNIQDILPKDVSVTLNYPEVPSEQFETNAQTLLSLVNQNLTNHYLSIIADKDYIIALQAESIENLKSKTRTA
jgi:transcriptional regulator with XRE-family HTH domain